MTLQAAVTEPIKPVLNSVVMAVHGPGTYASQSDKGEIVFGGALDRYSSYTQRGAISTLQSVAAGLIETFPSLSRVKLMRQWGGTVDVVPDSSPIIDEISGEGSVHQLRLGNRRLQSDSGGWLAACALAGNR